MRAVTLEPRRAGSLRLEEISEPATGQLLVRTRAVGICGTDRDLIDGHYGQAPPGRPRLVLGHESLGSVVDAPPQSPFRIGDTVVGIVRNPDPVPCAHCAAGECDMCSNGRYTEHGIKGADGFAAELFSVNAAVKVDPRLDLAAVLLEPASVLAKAWEHIERIGQRALWRPKRLLVTGAGPVGLLAALFGMQRGLEVHVQDHNERGPKRKLAEGLGARYSVSAVNEDFDVIIECTGARQVIRQVLGARMPNRIVCLTGLPGEDSDASLDAQALVRDNGVNTRKVPLRDWRAAYEKQAGDVKTVMLFED